MSESLADHSASTASTATVTALLRTVVLCDLVESTALVERLGDGRAAALMQRHDKLLASLLKTNRGQLIDKADGALALFERPVQALEFALSYQRGLIELGRECNESLSARVGIHVGDVMTWTNTPEAIRAGAKKVEVEGLAKPIAARLMSLALPGQILMSGMAQNLAQRAQGELENSGRELRWLLHGRYRFKGVPAPMLVHEVGEAGLAPLKAPPSTSKVWRELPVWRRPPVLAVELLVLVALVVAGVWSTLRSPPAIAFAERDWVVVADFKNLTGETLYDDALDSALRIGLEQSRYVNVLSDLQIDQALQRMQQAGRSVDRHIGTELALREGAKALVLPTVSEAGGRPRVSVEVVDPHSGVTVYTHMADVSGNDSVVAALDNVLADLRLDLGESLASIEENAVPLEQATTPNIEALRAFSLGVRARMNDRLGEAMEWYGQAVKLDPGFSMAYQRMGFVMYSEGKTDEAQRYLDLAAAHRERLTHREAMYLDASLAVFETPALTLEKLKAMAMMYPDEYRVYYNYAYFARQDALRYQEGLDFLTPALSARSVFQPNAYYEQGMLNLASDRLDAAIASFKQAVSLGAEGRKGSYADTHAARREYALAQQVVATQPDSGLANWQLDERRGEIVYPLDQGQWLVAMTAVRALAAAMQGASPAAQADFDLLRLSLRSYDPDTTFLPDLRGFLSAQKVGLQEVNALERRYRVFRIMAAGAMAAQAGDANSARAALATAGALAEEGGYPANADMARVLRAELALADAQPQAAIAILAPRAGHEDTLYFLHAVLMRAYAAAGDFESALAQADSLAMRRGRAYGEHAGNYSWQAVNVIENNLALLAAEHFARQLGRTEAAKARAAAFDQAWPGGRRLSVATRRMKQL